jgi:thiopeptide-type bacteriocin biosynthesis protein
MIKRKFIPGTEWIYFKIYTGVKTADIVLHESILPLVNQFLEEKYIKKWFFIRYNDPKPHLRIRFELTDINNYNLAFSQINNYLEKYTVSGEISDLTQNTYTREIERYGAEIIDEAEIFFYKNSKIILQEYLDFDDEEKIIVSFFYIDKMLDQLGLSTDYKLKWIGDSNAAFKKEFNADKKLNAQLDKKYREFKLKYADFLNLEDYHYFREMIITEVNESKDLCKNIISKTDPVSLQRFFESIFHMDINRLFISNQRLFEMIIYDYMFRYYKSLYFKNIKTGTLIH